MLSPGARKLSLSVHLTVSVGWIGAVLAYLGLGTTAVRADDPGLIRAMWSAMEIVGWYVIVPLALSSLLTGLLMALGTKWGLFQHYWVTISFGLTVFAVVVLLLHMPSVTTTADLALSAEGKALQALGGDLEHPAIGLSILLAIQVLNLYKPKGLTRHGWRKQLGKRSRSGADEGAPL
jgi:hypothetical protein